MAKARDVAPEGPVELEQVEAEAKTVAPALALVIAIGALLGLFVLPRIAPGPGATQADARIAPDFTLPVAANGEPGARMQLSDLREKVVVLDFWASWCGPCGMQAPILERVAQRHPDDVVVVGINVGESPAIAKRYAEVKKLSYPILADVDGEAQDLYDATTLPTVVVIDRQGKVQRLVHGVMRESAIEKAIRSL